MSENSPPLRFSAIRRGHPKREFDPRYFFDPNTAGRLRYQQRHGAGPIAIAILILGSLIFVPFTLAVAWAWGLVTFQPRPSSDDLTPDLFLTCSLGILGFFGLIVLIGSCAHTKVYDRAIVTGPGFFGLESYLIPLNTIDPSRIRYHRRVGVINRRLKLNVVEARTVRGGLHSHQAISFPGLTPMLAHPRHRHKLMSWPLWDAEGLDIIRIKHDPPYNNVNIRLATWVIGTRKPEPLLRAIEHALVDAGRIDAVGITDRCLTNPVIERWRQPLTDADIYPETPEDPETPEEPPTPHAGDTTPM